MKKKIKIHILHCGDVGVDPAVPFRDVSKNPIAYTGIGRSIKHRIWLPVSAYLIEHPKGLVLFDTGWHKDVRINEKKHMSWKLNYASKARLPEGMAVDEQLNNLGINTSDLDYVFLSHMDVDHVSGVELVKDAKKILISDEEFDAIKKSNIRYNNKLWENVNIIPFKMCKSQYGPFNRAFDVFEDGTVLMLDAHGHTEGNIIARIENNEKFVLLTADCGYAKESWENLRLPGPISNKRDMLTALKWVQKNSKDKSCIDVLATHDSHIKPHIVEL